MHYFLFLLAFSFTSNNAQECQKQVPSLTKIGLYTVAKYAAQDADYFKKNPRLPDDLMQEITKNYNYHPATPWIIPYFSPQKGKIVAFNTFYCFVQSGEETLHRIDLLNRSTIEKKGITKLKAIADNGRYCISGDQNSMSVYDFKSNTSSASPSSDKAWICNNIYFLFLQNDLLSIWKMNHGNAYHQQSLSNIKNCYTFACLSKILLVSQAHNSYRYSLYSCNRNLTLACWHTDQPLTIYATHLQKSIIAASGRYNKQDLILYHFLRPTNSRRLEHCAPVITACFLPKLKAIATVTDQPDNTLRIWDMSENKRFALYSADKKPTIESLWWLPIGLYAQDKEGNCWFWHHKIITAKRECKSAHLF